MGLTQSGQDSLEAGLCVVFGRPDDADLRAFAQQLDEHLQLPKAGTGQADAPGVEYWTPEDLAAPAFPDEADSNRAERESELLSARVNTLVKAIYFIADLDADRDSALYLLGAREALTRNLTFAAHRGGLNINWPHGLAPTCIDLKDIDWGKVKSKVAGFLPPLTTQVWNNGFRASQAARVISPAQVLRRDGHIEGRATKDQPADARASEIWRLSSAPNAPRVGMTFGGIEKVTEYPVWINSENVDMQMGRVVDRSISSTIRARGANWTGLDEKISDDAMFLELSRQMGARNRLNIGEAIATRVDPDSDLFRFNNVTCVIHVATVKPGEPGRGYYAAGNMGECLKSALSTLADYQRQFPQRELGKALFPLFGAGDGGLAPAIAAAQMVGGLKQWLLGKDHCVNEAMFIAREVEVATAIRRAFRAHGFEPVAPDASDHAKTAKR